MNGDKQFSRNHISLSVVYTLRSVRQRGYVFFTEILIYVFVYELEQLNRKLNTCPTNYQYLKIKKENLLTWPCMLALTNTAKVSGQGMLTYKTIECTIFWLKKQ